MIRRKGKRSLNWKERLGISNLFLANDRLDAENDNRVLGKFFQGTSDYADLANTFSKLSYRCLLLIDLCVCYYQLDIISP